MDTLNLSQNSHKFNSYKQIKYIIHPVFKV